LTNSEAVVPVDDNRSLGKRLPAQFASLPLDEIDPKART
jgi:hypothetical protein